MRRVLAVALKELLQARRDPITLAMLLGLPTFMLLVYGYALSFDVRHAPFAIEDRDASEASRALVAAFAETPYFDLVGSLEPGADLHRVTERRDAVAILVVPGGFARRLARGERAPVQLVLDGANASMAATLLGYAEAIVAAVNGERVRVEAERAGRPWAPPIRYRPRVWYNPELASTQFLVPGLIGFILMLTAVVSTAISVVREKERGTLEQLRASSLSSGQLILGKVLPYLAVSLVATAMILVAARVLFDVEVRGSYLDLLLSTLLYLVGALGFGLLISTAVESQALAFQVGTISSMMPALFLSGFIFPIESMPLALRVISHAVPARYYMAILRGIILKGAPLTSFPEQMGFLALYSAIVLGLAWARLARGRS